MNESIRIRACEAGDIGTLAPLFDAYRQFYEQAPDTALAERFLRARFEAGESVILVAERDDGGFVGFCQLYPTFCSLRAEPIYVLSDLFVDPAARRNGVARALLRAANERARDDGMVRMDLTTARTNAKAQALYESMGWRRDEVFLTYNLVVSS